MAVPIRKIEPNAGPQTMLLSSHADIRGFGGGAGGGKSFAILLDALRYRYNPQVSAVTFRRTSPQLTQAGGLWETSREIYAGVGGIPRESPSLDWRFPGGLVHQFRHLQHESNRFAWQGAQVTVMNFDEATHFTKNQFWYLQSRVRSMSGVRGYINLTCNPDPDWWGLELFSWYIDDDGFPIPERCGKLRWFIRSQTDDKLIWAFTRRELIERYPIDGKDAKSVTFIPSKLTDNPKLLEKDPGYLGTLKALSLVDRARLLGGNWKIRETAGNVFRREWFPVVEAAPADALVIRYWDRAGTEDPEKRKHREAAGKDPDYTVGLRLSLDSSGIFYVEHVLRFRGSPLEVKRAIKNTATQDTDRVSIGIEQDPGQAGKSEAEDQVRSLSGFNAHVYPARQNKIVRAKPVSAQAEAGNIKIVRGSWNEDFLQELQNFPDHGHDDQVDALSGAFNALNEMNENMAMVG